MKFLLLLLTVLIIAIEVLSFAPRSKRKHIATKTTKCGYASCPIGEPDKLNVHLVSHSHDDVGWLKTVDEYFYGDKNDIQIAGVQYILDTVIDELEKDPERRFIYVETSFFWRWWNSRDDNLRNKLRSLVESGRLEFIGGGWSMNDEASNHYGDTIDQMTWGMRFLNDTLGECARPRVAWQIDPFGHSRESASLFAQMGFDGLFIGRLDYQDKDVRKISRTMELLWNASANLGVDGQLFTGVLPNGYNPPDGFCFDNLCADEPIQDNPTLKNYNVDKKVDAFLKIVSDQATVYRTNHLIMTMGSDFQYQNARTWFVNLDKLIAYVNDRQTKGSGVNVFYSTPSCYLQALNRAGLTWTVKTDDFFPYASDPHAYWTGYFTSRPALKRYIKYTNSILQVGKQLSAAARLGPENELNLEPLKRYQGDAQHHDAVSGTSKQAVADDYAESLAVGVNFTTRAINNAYAKILPKRQAAPPSQFICHYLNVSFCDITESSDQFAVTVYNPLGHSYENHVRVPIRKQLVSYDVIGDDGQIVQSQTVPVPVEVIDNPEHLGNATVDLVFTVQLPPMGHVTYFVRKSNEVGNKKHKRSKVIATTSTRRRRPENANDIVIQNSKVKVTVDGGTGLLRCIDDLANEISLNVSQNFYYYLAMSGDNQEFDKRASGAYIFRPNGTVVHRVDNKSVVETWLVTGPIVQEIHQTFADYVSQVIRIYEGSPRVELEWQVGPIPIADGFGKEIVSHFDTDLNTGEVFYTDSNGREILERIRDYRPTWEVNVTEPVSGNYYPVNSRIYIKDGDKDCQLTILTDRSQGGSSLEKGTLQLMVHRRLLHDDAFGVGQALNESGVDGRGLIVRGKHQLLVNSVSRAASQHRAQALEVSWPPLITLSPLTNATSIDDWRRDFITRHSSLTANLPYNVHLLTFEPWKEGTILLRLEHYLEKTDDPGGLSEPVIINLTHLFRELTVTSAVETTLGANLWLADLRRFSWISDEEDNSIDSSKYRYHLHKKPSSITSLGDYLDVALQPMQIRTFVITVNDNYATK